LKKTVFTGSAVALITPFNDKGQVNQKALSELIEFQISEGTDAIAVCATTGESATLSDKEQQRIIHRAAEQIRSRVPLIAGASSNDTAHAVRLVKNAYAAGADAHLQVTPYYNKTTQKGLVRHYLTLAEAADMPMILYNVPQRTGMDILETTYKELSTHPNVSATKEASGDVAKAVRIRALCGDELDVYSGDDILTLPLLSVGAKGVISASANVIPRIMHNICKYFFEGRIKESEALQVRFSDLMKALFSETNPIPVKAAAELLGLCSQNTRPPLTKISATALEQVKTALARHNLIQQ